jgi:hypothetical protein
MRQSALLPAKNRHRRHLLLERQRQIGGEEAGQRDILGDVARTARVALPLHQAAAQDDMRRQLLHDEAIEIGLVMEDGRDERPDFGTDAAEIAVFVEGAVERHRPALARRPDIRERLLDADRAGRPIDEKDQIEIAVADLADAPGLGAAAQALADIPQAHEEAGQRRLVERLVGFGRFERHGIGVTRPPPRRRGGFSARPACAGCGSRRSCSAADPGCRNTPRRPAAGRGRCWRHAPRGGAAG